MGNLDTVIGKQNGGDLPVAAYARLGGGDFPDQILNFGLSQLRGRAPFSA